MVVLHHGWASDGSVVSTEVCFWWTPEQNHYKTPSDLFPLRTLSGFPFPAPSVTSFTPRHVLATLRNASSSQNQALEREKEILTRGNTWQHAVVRCWHAACQLAVARETQKCILLRMEADGWVSWVAFPTVMLHLVTHPAARSRLGAGASQLLPVSARLPESQLWLYGHKCVLRSSPSWGRWGKL